MNQVTVDGKTLQCTVHGCNRLDACGKEQNIALIDMFWSEQMFPNPHGGCASENNTPVPGVTLELLATNCYLLKLIKIEHQKCFIRERVIIHPH